MDAACMGRKLSSTSPGAAPKALAGYFPGKASRALDGAVKIARESLPSPSSCLLMERARRDGDHVACA